MAGSSKFTRGVGVFGKLKAIAAFGLGTSDVYEESKIANISISSANILAMNGAPVTVLAAPGTGLALVVDSAILKVVTTATAYANGGTVDLVYHGGSTLATTGAIAAAVITAGAGTSYTAFAGPAAAGGTTLIANTAIDITNNSAAFITGTGTATLHIRYRIVTLP